MKYWDKACIETYFQWNPVENFWSFSSLFSKAFEWSDSAENWESARWQFTTHREAARIFSFKPVCPPLELHGSSQMDHNRPSRSIPKKEHVQKEQMGKWMNSATPTVPEPEEVSHTVATWSHQQERSLTARGAVWGCSTIERQVFIYMVWTSRGGALDPLSDVPIWMRLWQAAWGHPEARPTVLSDLDAWITVGSHGPQHPLMSFSVQEKDLKRRLKSFLFCARLVSQNGPSVLGNNSFQMLCVLQVESEDS